MVTVHHTACHLVDNVRPIESPLITDLAAALLHLQRITNTAGTPTEETRYYHGRVSPEQFARWVHGNADRIREALNTITAPYPTT